MKKKATIVRSSTLSIKDQVYKGSSSSRFVEAKWPLFGNHYLTIIRSLFFFSLSALCIFIIRITTYSSRHISFNSSKYKKNAACSRKRQIREIKSPPRIFISLRIYIHLALASVLSPSLSTEHHKAGAGERSVLGGRDKRGWQLKQKTQATLLYDAYSISCISLSFVFARSTTYDLIFELNRRI